MSSWKQGSPSSSQLGVEDSFTDEKQKLAKKVKKKSSREIKKVDSEKSSSDLKKKKKSPSATKISDLGNKSDELSQAELEAELLGLEKSKTKDLPDKAPNDIYQIYSTLQNFARQFNTRVAIPEIVLLGPVNSGKSSLLEALIGVKSTIVGKATKRPIFFNLVNKQGCNTPHITIKRDRSLKQFDNDLEVSLSDLPSELEKRNQNFDSEPIYVQYEYSQCMNITFIDTPGLDFEKGGTTDTVLKLISPVHRNLLVVEETQQWKHVRMLKFIRTIDPDLLRSTFAYTKFQKFISEYRDSRVLHKFLLETRDKSFFVSLPIKEVRNRCNSEEDYQKKLSQYYFRDYETLERLQFDSKFAPKIGIHFLKATIEKQFRKDFRESLPTIKQDLTKKQFGAQNSKINLEKELESFTIGTLRLHASNYVVTYLQSLQSLILGTVEGNPMINGHTLDDEKGFGGAGDWVDQFNQPIFVESTGIPFGQNKLYGGPQLRRIFSEFKLICEQQMLSEVGMSDIASVAGISGQSDARWAACDLVQRRFKDMFIPLINQLCDRMCESLILIADVTERMLDARKRKDELEGKEPANDYPYFSHHIKDLFQRFVETTTAYCKVKCMDEFYSTQTIHWELTELWESEGFELPDGASDDQVAGVAAIAESLFQTLRTRLIDNITTKVYNFLLYPIQYNLWSDIQAKITALNDDNLAQMFNIQTLKDSLNSEIQQAESVLSQCGEQATEFVDAATKFSALSSLI